MRGSHVRKLLGRGSDRYGRVPVAYGRTGGSFSTLARLGRRPLGPVSCVVLAICFAGSASAGEREGAPRGDSARESGLVLADWEWMSEGRRNPFEFAPPREEAREEVDVRDSRTAEELAREAARESSRRASTPEEPDRGSDRRKARSEATVRAAEAEAYLGWRKFSKVEELTSQALRGLEEVELVVPDLNERLERLRATARRLREREEAESEFEKMRIDIQGIVWEPGNAVALINGLALREGDTIAGAPVEVEVEEIRADEVIFVMKGVRVRKRR
jgi:hypothetical protein